MPDGSWAEDQIVVAAFVHQNKKRVAYHINWPEPLKYVHFPKPQNLEINFNGNGNHLKILSDVPVKCLQLECADEITAFGDNGIDLFPGEPVIVPVEHLTKDGLKKINYFHAE